MPRLTNRGRRRPRGAAPAGARAMLRGVGWGRGYRRAVGWAVGKARCARRRWGSAQGPRVGVLPAAPAPAAEVRSWGRWSRLRGNPAWGSPA